MGWCDGGRCDDAVATIEYWRVEHSQNGKGPVQILEWNLGLHEAGDRLETTMCYNSLPA
jgi:hypothetical protein